MGCPGPPTGSGTSCPSPRGDGAGSATIEPQGFRAWKAACEQLLDLSLGPVAGLGHQVGGVLGRQVGSEPAYGGQVEPPVRHGLEDDRELARCPGRPDPLVGGVLGQVEHLDAVGVHRGTSRGQVEPPGIELGDVGEHAGGGLAFLRNRGGQIAQQLGVAQMRQGVGAHGGEPFPGAGVLNSHHACFRRSQSPATGFKRSAMISERQRERLAWQQAPARVIARARERAAK